MDHRVGPALPHDVIESDRIAHQVDLGVRRRRNVVEVDKPLDQLPTEKT